MENMIEKYGQFLSDTKTFMETIIAYGITYPALSIIISILLFFIGRFATREIYKKEMKIRIIELYYKERLNVFQLLFNHLSRIGSAVQNYNNYKDEAERKKAFDDISMNIYIISMQYSIYVEPIEPNIEVIRAELEKIKKEMPEDITKNRDILFEEMSKIGVIIRKITGIKELDSFMHKQVRK